MNPLSIIMQWMLPLGTIWQHNPNEHLGHFFWTYATFKVSQTCCKACLCQCRGLERVSGLEQGRAGGGQDQPPAFGHILPPPQKKKNQARLTPACLNQYQQFHWHRSEYPLRGFWDIPQGKGKHVLLLQVMPQLPPDQGWIWHRLADLPFPAQFRIGFSSHSSVNLFLHLAIWKVLSTKVTHHQILISMPM